MNKKTTGPQPAPSADDRRAARKEWDAAMTAMTHAMGQQVTAQNAHALALQHLHGCWARLHAATQRLQALSKAPAQNPGKTSGA